MKNRILFFVVLNLFFFVSCNAGSESELKKEGELQWIVIADSEKRTMSIDSLENYLGLTKKPTYQEEDHMDRCPLFTQRDIESMHNYLESMNINTYNALVCRMVGSNRSRIKEQTHNQNTQQGNIKNNEFDSLAALHVLKLMQEGAADAADLQKEMLENQKDATEISKLALVSQKKLTNVFKNATYAGIGATVVSFVWAVISTIWAMSSDTTC